MYYDRDGRKIDLSTWARLFETTDRQVAYTQVRDGVHVSTVWLGLDHNPYGHGPPLIFETMVFGGSLHGEQWRWPTEALAVAGHDQMVAFVRERETAPVDGGHVQDNE